MDPIIKGYLLVDPHSCSQIISGIVPSNSEVNWIRVVCPVKASIKDVCWEILQTASELTYLQASHRKKIEDHLVADDLINAVTKICDELSIRLIIIDKLQNLASVQIGSSELVYDFFVELSNSAKVLVFFQS